MNDFKRILALDVGDKTIGMAISDLMGWTAQGLHTIRRETDQKDLEALKKVIDEYQVSQLVVGLPKNMNGTIGPQAEKVREFIELIRPEFNCSITEWDERLSTKMAERSLIETNMRRSKRKKIIDTAAAVCILQGYLDYLQNQSKIPKEEPIMPHDHNHDHHDHNHDHDHNHEDNIVTLVDETGEEQDFEIIMTLELEDLEYAILLPLDADDDEEAYIFRMDPDPDDKEQVMLIAVEDDDEFDKVAAAYEAMIDDIVEEGDEEEE